MLIHGTGQVSGQVRCQVSSVMQVHELQAVLIHSNLHTFASAVMACLIDQISDTDFQERIDCSNGLTCPKHYIWRKQSQCDAHKKLTTDTKR